MSPAQDGSGPEAGIRERLARMDQRIEAAGGHRGGPGGVEVVAVTKGHPAAVVRAVLATGLTIVGESYAQELVAKARELPDVRWHFLGQLQTNKVRAVAPLVDVVQSLDRPSLVAELAKRAPGMEVFVQVDLAAAAGAAVSGRGGVAIGDAVALADLARDAGLVVGGVMGVAPQGGEPQVATAFGALRRLADRLQVAHCSMGMSDDLELAVREGSTMVRIGTALLGPRTVLRR